jgi:hypothetical protein
MRHDLTLEEVVTVVEGLYSDDTEVRATAHTSAVLASEWEDVETALAKAD